MVEQIDSDEWMTAKRMAKLLVCDRNWVMRRISLKKYATVERVKIGRSLTYYEPQCFADMARQRTRFMNIPPVGTYLTLNQVAEEMGCNWLTVKNTFEGLGIKPSYRRDQQNRLIPCYAPKAVSRLKSHITKVRPMWAADYLTAHALAALSGYSRATVVRRLDRLNIAPELRHSAQDGRSYHMYPPVAIVKLGVRPIYPPGANWLTMTALCRMTGLPDYQVRVWLERTTPRWEWRFDDASVPRRHYPPAIVQRISADYADRLQIVS